MIVGLHEQEQRLKALVGVNILFLRPVSFFENFYDTLGSIREQGVVADSVVPDLALPMVATRDVARVAAQALARRNWRGAAVRELLGPRDISYCEATRIVANRLRRPEVEYVQLAYADMADALVGAGLSATFAELYVAMTRAFNEGRVQPRSGRTTENTTPTRFEDFASELALAYDAAVAAPLERHPGPGPGMRQVRW